MNNESNRRISEIEFLQIEQRRLNKEIGELQDFLYAPFNDEEPEFDYDYDEHMNQQNKHPDEIRLNNKTRELEEINDRFGILKRTEFLDENLTKIAKNSTKTTKSDSLNRNSLATNIATLIAEQEEDSNLSIGVLGTWGSGKTTFLNLIEKHLDAPDSIIRFDASKYDDQEQIWYSLLSSVSHKYLSSGCHFLKKMKFLLKYLTEKKQLSIIYTPLIILFVLFFLLTLCIASIKNFSTTLPFIHSALAIVSTGVGYLTYESIKKAYKELEKYFISSNEQILKQLKYPNYRELLGTRENVRTELTIFKSLILQEAQLSNIVIMIDELDRCSEKTIRNFFSAIEAFIDIPGIVFIFAFNADIVYPAVSKIPEQESKGNTNNNNIGVEFVEKYINLFFTLPSVVSYEDYVNSLLNDIIHNENDKNRLIRLINFTSKTIDTSPREVKKLLDLSLIYHKQFINISYSEFAIILILQYYFSVFDNLENKGLQGTQFSDLTLYQLKRFIKTKCTDELFKLILELLPDINIDAIIINIKEVNNVLKYTKY